MLPLFLFQSRLELLSLRFQRILQCIKLCLRMNAIRHGTLHQQWISFSCSFILHLMKPSISFIKLIWFILFNHLCYINLIILLYSFDNLCNQLNQIKINVIFALTMSLIRSALTLILLILIFIRSILLVKTIIFLKILTIFCRIRKYKKW